MPSKNDTLHVACFSGGKDSTAMVLRLVEEKAPLDLVVCADTTKEFPDMYTHIARVEEMIAPIPLVRVSFDFDYYFGQHIKTKGTRIGEVGYGWPDFRVRWCTRLKHKAIHAYLRSLPGVVVEYRGITSEERARLKKNKRDPHKMVYPLVTWQMTQRDTLAYCYEHGLDWNGLYKKFFRVSCFCCPLSRISELRTLYWDYPDLWRQMQEMDKLSARKFRANATLAQLEERFIRERTGPASRLHLF